MLHIGAMDLINKLMGTGRSKRAHRSVSFDAEIQPASPFYVIGDIHGEFTHLDSILTQIETSTAEPSVVCVGDYIDRGPRSADVLRWLKRLNDEFGDRFVCLMGNHELMLLQFLRNPIRYGERWFRYGGLQTLASYGVGRSGQYNDHDVRDALQEAMGLEMTDWIAQLPYFWVNGNVAVVHAGADPEVPIDLQSTEALCWGHDAFLETPRSDGFWVAHGHTIVDEPRAVNGRISVDTGAYATGRLTAAHIRADGITYLFS